MPYLIDGHNLIGQTPGLSLADPDDEAKLAQMVKRFCGRRRKRAVLVFDKGLPGGKSSLSGAGVEVVFASEASSADALIRSRLQRLRDVRNWTVVTSDNSLAETARQRGARVTPSAEFAAAMLAAGQSEEKEKPSLAPGEVEQWEAEFRRARRQAKS
jgi:predicted RNA-binding protein with PIN domain